LKSYRKKWLAETVFTLTQPLIPIPYNPKLLQEIKKSHPSIQQLLKNAEKYAKILEKGLVRSQAELAKKENVSRARITQILNLLKLHPEIRHYLRNRTSENQTITERQLRRLTNLDASRQIREFEILIEDRKETSP
jgi:hypothetical protein